MSDSVYTEPSNLVPTPSSTFVRRFMDSDNRMKTKNSAGLISNTSALWNFSTASQAPAAATRTYITGSQIAVPAIKLQIGSQFRWTFDITKTAAGTAASTYDIAFGTAGTTADTARVSFTKPAGTAAVDVGIVTIMGLVRGPLSSSGIVSGNFQLTHTGGATGVAGHTVSASVCLNTISSTFDVTTVTFVGLCITTGTADAITIQQVMTEVWNL